MEGASDGLTIDKLTVRILTGIYRGRVVGNTKPSCKAAWQGRLRLGFAPLPYDEIAMLYRNVLLTPKDYASHFKNILHRRLWVRSKTPRDGSNKCRCCGNVIEHIHHIADCEVIRPAFDHLLRLSKQAKCNLTVTRELLLLGVGEDNHLIPLGVASLLILLYKFIIIRFTAVDLDNAKFNALDCWTGACYRFITRVNALVHKSFLESRKAAAASQPLPQFRTRNKYLAPLAHISPQGRLEWAAGVFELLMPAALTSAAVTTGATL